MDHLASSLTNKKAEDLESMARAHYPEVGSHGWNHIQDVLEAARRIRRRELIKKEIAAIMSRAEKSAGYRRGFMDKLAEFGIWLS